MIPLSVMSVKNSVQHVLFHEYKNFYELPIWTIFGSNLFIRVRKIEIESKNKVAEMDSFI